MSEITFTRRKNALGQTEYHYETETLRFIVRPSARTGRGFHYKWEVMVWTLKTVGTMEPILKIRDSHLTSIGASTLDEAREDIAGYLERRAR
jgi:hypothetical protein